MMLAIIITHLAVIAQHGQVRISHDTQKVIIPLRLSASRFALHAIKLHKSLWPCIIEAERRQDGRIAAFSIRDRVAHFAITHAGSFSLIRAR